MNHPGKELIEKIKARGFTQKDFSLLVGKKVSELNELIKGKRNITIQWDILLSSVLDTPEKYRILKQIDYDYYNAKNTFSKSKKLIENKKDKEIFITNKKEYDFEQNQQKNSIQKEHIKETKENQNIGLDPIDKKDVLEEKIKDISLKENNIQTEEFFDKKTKDMTNDYPDFYSSPEIDALDDIDNLDINEVSENNETQKNSQDNFEKTDNENIFIDF